MAALRSLPVPPSEIVIVTDRPPSDAEAAAAGIEWRHGDAGVAMLRSIDCVIRSPGISRYREDAESVARATRVTTGTNLWFAEHAGDMVIAVTGSKGKSTTSSLIAHLAQAAGLRTVLAGNIGVPLLSVLHPEPIPDLWVVELSSQQIADMDMSPRIGVLLNLYREHVDWHGSVERYVEDKLNLFAHGEETVAVLNREDKMTRAYTRGLRRPVWFADPDGYHTDGRSLLWGDERLIDAQRLQLLGRHNLVNACAALAALDQAGVDARAQVEALPAFHPLRHRLEPVGDVDGVGFIDDSISTIPESAVAALDAMYGAETVLIAGGFDRGQDHAPLVRRVRHAANVLAVVALPPSGWRLAADLQAQDGSPPVVHASDLSDAVRLACQCTRPGSVVLLSPAAPSYGAFRDFEERGDAFRALVAELGGAPVGGVMRGD